MMATDSNNIKKVVFPIAGLGTRFLPATKASPKEMLAIVDKPLIQYAVEEAYSAGFRQMIFVTGRTKRSIEDHFDMAYELEHELEQSGKLSLLSLLHQIKPDDMQCFYVRQSRPLGLGHAILCAKDLVGNEPFGVMLADDLMVSESSVIKQLKAQFADLNTSVIAIEKVPINDTKLYGIVSGLEKTNRLLEIKHIVEKPNPENAPSTLAVAGRYIFTPALFDALAKQTLVGGEILLADGIASLMSQQKVYAYRFDGTRYDCGSKLGFLKATVDLALTHPEVSHAFNKWLKHRFEVEITTEQVELS